MRMKKMKTARGRTSEKSSVKIKNTSDFDNSNGYSNFSMKDDSDSVTGSFADVESDADSVDDGHAEVESELDSTAENNSDSEESDVEEDGDEFVKHKKALSKLQTTDPDFYQYLQENDKKLLQFATDSDSDDDDKVHQPPDALEADSEESDFEPEDGQRNASDRTITLAMVKKWKEDLISNPCLDNVTVVVKGFNAALARVQGEESSHYKVEGSSVFNAVVELCVMHLENAITKFLKLPKNNKQPQKSKKWVKIRVTVQSYLSDLLKLLSGVSSNHIVSVLLKHLHAICYLVVCFNKLGKNCLKLMSSLWSGGGEESVRVLAYLCILRLTTCQTDSKNTLLDPALKLLYISYVKNTRFVSTNTLPQINFMRRSLADLFTINPTLSYQHAFLYIRQLAIHLRNAVTLRKKERFQTVYNWQYINSLHLWVELLCCQKEQLNELGYPLITIILGCIKLIPTAQYVPLRFHCLNMLIKLNRITDTYIPILPYILETFSIVNLNMKHKKSSMKPFDLTCVLRLSKGAMSESAFTDAVIENVYQLLIDTCYNHRNSISFPDLMVPVVIQLRTFIRTTKVSKYSAKLKPLLAKLEENARFITNERNKLSVNLSETDKIKAFEANIQLKGTPLEKLWVHWSRAQTSIRSRKVEEKEDKTPKEEQMFTIRKDLKRKPNSGGPTVLFPSDDESTGEISTLLCGPVEEDEDEEPSKKSKVSDQSEESSEESIKEESEELDSDSNNDQEDIVKELNISSF